MIGEADKRISIGDNKLLLNIKEKKKYRIIMIHLQSI